MTLSLQQYFLVSWVPATTTSNCCVTHEYRMYQSRPLAGMEPGPPKSSQPLEAWSWKVELHLDQRAYPQQRPAA